MNPTKILLLRTELHAMAVTTYLRHPELSLLPNTRLKHQFVFQTYQLRIQGPAPLTQWPQKSPQSRFHITSCPTSLDHHSKASPVTLRSGGRAPFRVALSSVSAGPNPPRPAPTHSMRPSSGGGRHRRSGRESSRAGAPPTPRFTRP